jgi:hypothetical protein
MGTPKTTFSTVPLSEPFVGNGFTVNGHLVRYQLTVSRSGDRPVWVDKSVRDEQKYYIYLDYTNIAHNSIKDYGKWNYAIDV